MQQLQRLQGNERPIYILRQSKKRAVLPKVISLLLLSIIFYLGILLNVKLLDITAKQETMVKLISLFFLLAVLIIGSYLSFRRARIPYIFYRDRLSFRGNSLPYLAIENTAPHYDFLDRMLGSCSFNLDGSFILKHIPKGIDLGAYLRQLKEYVQKAR